MKHTLAHLPCGDADRGDQVAQPPPLDLDMPDFFLFPVQFFPDPDLPETGARRLLFAVLEDAIASLLRAPPQKPTARALAAYRRQRADALAWFTETDSGWLFSFESICAQFRLPADSLRRGLIAQYNQPPRKENDHAPHPLAPLPVAA